MTLSISQKESAGKIALVTGGTRGIGAAVSRTLQHHGYTVVASYGTNTQQAMHFHNQTRIPVYAWDVGDHDACQKSVARIVSDIGPIEILVNNAGICNDAPLETMTPEQWHSVINTNLNSVFYMCKAALPSMRAKGNGRIITIGSMNGFRSAKGIANYSASKAGIIGLTKSLAHEVARYGITANVIAPGYIRTDLIEALPVPILERIMKEVPLRRLGIPEEVAQLVLFLTSAGASFITGSTMHINGGQWMC